MKEKIWRRNNSKLSVLDTPAEKELSHEEWTRLLQADVNSQLMWITTKSCTGISCSDCYIKEQCTSRLPSESQALAGAIIKGAISK